MGCREDDYRRIDEALLQLLVSGAAHSLHEAEEQYLDTAIPEVLELLRGPATNEELGRHPLLLLMLAHGSRGWEDSLL